MSATKNEEASYIIMLVQLEQKDKKRMHCRLGSLLTESTITSNKKTKYLTLIRIKVTNDTPDTQRVKKHHLSPVKHLLHLIPEPQKLLVQLGL